MGIFRLPVVKIGKKSDGGFGGSVSTLRPSFVEDQSETGGEAGEETVRAREAIKLVTEHRQVRAATAGAGVRAGGDYTDVPSMFLENAKEVIARCIQAGLIGDAAARDFFRNYSAYLAKDPDTGYEDFLTFAYKDSEDQALQVAGLLNSTLDYPLTRLEVEPGRVAAGFSGVLEGDLLAVLKRCRVPLLAASTNDLLVFGVANPYLSRHFDQALRHEVPTVENSYRYYLLLSPSQLENAIAKMSMSEVV